jgi:hypothetical protein
VFKKPGPLLSTQLYYLVRYGSQDKVIEYLRKSKPSAPRTEPHERLLNTATSSNAVSVVKWLLDNGEPATSATTVDSGAPLFVAVVGALGSGHDREREALRIASEALYANKEVGVAPLSWTFGHWSRRLADSAPVAVV